MIPVWGLGFEFVGGWNFAFEFCFVLLNLFICVLDFFVVNYWLLYLTWCLVLVLVCLMLVLCRCLGWVCGVCSVL